jgi:Zn-dependent M28 family amino/carboxypeptidase
MVVSCQSTSNKKSQKNTPKIIVELPSFNSDSAYNYIQKQVDFGSRVPNTQAHQACGDYLVKELKSLGAQVIEQKAIVNAFDGTALNMRNIIASYQPNNFKRVLLAAHWDSRPWADHDSDPANHKKPILAANDGASGVGVLLEIARCLQQKDPSIGVDIILFDTEDYGAPEFYKGTTSGNDWCLGSQYWGNHPHKENYQARYGILLDMVGAKQATFYKEQYSMQTAANIVKKVWKKAQSIGYSAYFVDQIGDPITDDHYYVNELAGIPCIDIINYDASYEKNSFGAFWHTLGDNMDVIDKSTLKAVGETLIHVIYSEK